MQRLVILLSLLLFAGGQLSAQPILTAASTNPIAGQQYIENVFDSTIGPGPSGAGVTWDYSTLSYSTWEQHVVKYLSGCGTGKIKWQPNRGAYDDASYCIELTDSMQLITSWTRPEDFGNDYSTYSDPAELIHFPFTYLSSFTDSFKENAYLIMEYFHDKIYTGADTVTADGYGTLKTPFATITNVLRIHTHERAAGFTDDGTSISEDLNWTYDTYAWYDETGQIQATIQISPYTSHQRFYYRISPTTSIEEEAGAGIKVYVTSNSACIHIETPFYRNYQIRIFDMAGKMVYHNSISQSAAITPGLMPGIYLIEVKDQLTGRRMIQKTSLMN